MKLKIFAANMAGNTKNCLYPNKVEVTNADELGKVVIFDHVCAEYRNNYRSKDNFIRSNVLVMDCDNDHTEDPDKWITENKLNELMFDYPYAIAYSRCFAKKTVHGLQRLPTMSLSTRYPRS